jgi:hypothetical protein
MKQKSFQRLFCLFSGELFVCVYCGGRTFAFFFEFFLVVRQKEASCFFTGGQSKANKRYYANEGEEKRLLPMKYILSI